MRFARVLCAAALFGYTLSGSASYPFGQNYGDISIEVRRSLIGASGSKIHGYAALRIKASNRSPDKAHRVEIRFPSEGANSFWGPGRLKSLSKTIEVAPDSTAEAYFYKPWIRLDGRGEEAIVYIDGKKQAQNVHAFGTGLHGASGSFGGPFGGGSWVYSSAEPTVSFGAIRKSSFPVPSKINTRTRHSFDSTWLAYSGYDGIILSLSEANTLSADERAALWEYVKVGGSLAVMGLGQLSDDWARLDSRLANRELVSDSSERYEIGFGLLFLSEPPFFPTSSRPPAHTAIYDSWLETQEPWLLIYTAAGANKVFPVAKPVDTMASLRRMFFLALLFAAVIGPLNIAVLRRKKQMMRLYWTAPAISLTACLLFVLYFAVFEGVSKYTRVASLTMIDQESRLATTIGWIGFYSPTAHPDGLLFDEATELTLQQEALPRFSPPAMGTAVGMDRTGSVDWTDGQRWSGGWIQPRIPLHFKLRKSESRPERMDLKKEDGALKVVNRLGSRVKSLWYADHDGKVYQAADISNGSESVLTETNDVKIGLKKLRDVYASQDWVAKIEAVKASPVAYLQPGQYFAELEENAFVEKALKGAKMKPSTCLVLGILE